MKLTSGIYNYVVRELVQNKEGTRFGHSLLIILKVLHMVSVYSVNIFIQSDGVDFQSVHVIQLKNLQFCEWRKTLFKDSGKLLKLA